MFVYNILCNFWNNENKFFVIVFFGKIMLFFGKKDFFLIVKVVIKMSLC